MEQAERQTETERGSSLFYKLALAAPLGIDGEEKKRLFEPVNVTERQFARLKKLAEDKSLLADGEIQTKLSQDAEGLTQFLNNLRGEMITMAEADGRLDPSQYNDYGVKMLDRLISDYGMICEEAISLNECAPVVIGTLGDIHPRKESKLSDIISENCKSAEDLSAEIRRERRLNRRSALKNLSEFKRKMKPFPGKKSESLDIVNERYIPFLEHAFSPTALFYVINYIARKIERVRALNEVSPELAAMYAFHPCIKEKRVEIGLEETPTYCKFFREDSELYKGIIERMRVAPDLEGEPQNSRQRNVVDNGGRNAKAVDPMEEMRIGLAREITGDSRGEYNQEMLLRINAFAEEVIRYGLNEQQIAELGGSFSGFNLHSKMRIRETAPLDWQVRTWLDDVTCNFIASRKVPTSDDLRRLYEEVFYFN